MVLNNANLPVYLSIILNNENVSEKNIEKSLAFNYSHV